MAAAFRTMAGCARECALRGVCAAGCTYSRRVARTPTCAGSGGSAPGDGHPRVQRNVRTICSRVVQRQGGSAIRIDDGGLGRRRNAGRRHHRRTASLPRPELRCALAHIQPFAAAAHQCSDFRFWRLSDFCDVVLHRPAHLSHPTLFGRTRRLYVLGLATGHRARSHLAADGLDDQQRIRRTRMAHRHPNRSRLGGVCRGIPRNARQAKSRTHLRRQLVLRGVHHHGRDSAYREQRGDARDSHQKLFGLRRRRRCHGAVVVRTQCSRLFF